MDSGLSQKDQEIQEKAVLESRTLRRSGEASVLGPLTTCTLEPRRILAEGNTVTRCRGISMLGLSSYLGIGREGDAPQLEPQLPQHGDEGRGLTLFPGITVPGTIVNVA